MSIAASFARKVSEEVFNSGAAGATTARESVYYIEIVSQERENGVENGGGAGGAAEK